MKTRGARARGGALRALTLAEAARADGAALVDHLDGEIAPQQVNEHRTGRQPQAHQGRAHGRGSGAARLRLPYAPLPHPHARGAVGLHPHELHVGPIRERGVMFDDGAHGGYVEARRVVHQDHAVRVAHVDEGERIGVSAGFEHGVDDIHPHPGRGTLGHPRAARGTVGREGSGIDIGAAETRLPHVHPHAAVVE